jgi:hypothetical protein
MKSKIIVTLCLFSYSILSCRNNFYRTKSPSRVATVDNNVCKKLIGKVTLYAIFVDTKETHPWTTYDINTTLDSVRKATSWITKEAKENNIDIEIDVSFHQNNKIIPISQNLYNETLFSTLFFPNLRDGIENLDDWSNAIARKAGNAFGPDTATIVKTKNKITDRERLIARLRDITGTDNVVVMYFLNNYHQQEISLALHTGASEITEYSIVSFKSPAVIAHEFLHIFGALDLYMSPFDRKKRTLKNKVKIMKAYPNEIMAYTYRPIESLNISPLTKYFIGWTSTLDEESKKIMFGKKIKLIRY